jgi:hypothetical protein
MKKLLIIGATLIALSSCGKTDVSVPQNLHADSTYTDTTHADTISVTYAVTTTGENGVTLTLRTEQDSALQVSILHDTVITYLVHKPFLASINAYVYNTRQISYYTAQLAIVVHNSVISGYSGGNSIAAWYFQASTSCQIN